MPVVPIEENKVGIAGLTDAKLRPGDFSRSGLQALGSGLQAVGGAGQELGKALADTDPATLARRELQALTAQKAATAETAKRTLAAQLKAAAGRTTELLAAQTPKQAADDAAVKGSYNDYAEGATSLLYTGAGAMAARKGADALTAVQPTIDQLLKTRDDAAASLSPELHEAFHAAIAPRIAQDLHFVESQADAAALVAQRQQSQRVVNNSAQDAVLQFGTPAFGQSMATGLRQIDEQATAGGMTPEAKLAAETGFISGVHRKVSESLATSDPVLGADHLRAFGDHMTPEDRAAAWKALGGPLREAQAVADVDTLTIARSATAPLTPHGDYNRLLHRMLAITPAGPGATGANATSDLPALLDRYGGDAAKAWAASEMGTDALDALVAKDRATWFGALPTEARNKVAAHMAMLEAVSSPRRAPADHGALAMEIEDQPWSEERKQNALDELNTRIGLDARRVKQAQDDAKETGLALAEQLGPGFISVNQLPPAVRTSLAPDALAALTLRADRNVHPVTVAPHGDVAMDLNRMAANDPEGFGQVDLRLHRDEISPAEYAALERVQKGLQGYPPAPQTITQRRGWETMGQYGILANSSEPAPSGPFGDAFPQGWLRNISADDDSRISFGPGGRPVLGTDGKSVLESTLEPLLPTRAPPPPQSADEDGADRVFELFRSKYDSLKADDTGTRAVRFMLKNKEGYQIYDSNDEISGSSQWLLHGRGAAKCSVAVNDAFTSAGITPPKKDGHFMTTADWYNAFGKKIPGFSSVTWFTVGRNGLTPQNAADFAKRLKPGDIITNGDHVGLYVGTTTTGGVQQLWTISATTPNATIAGHPNAGILITSWPFRPPNGHDLTKQNRFVIFRATPRAP